jgi:hypothetical protein
MTTATGTPERTSEGFIVVHATYRNDDPAELSLMDDCWHRGAYWTFTVPGTSIREEGSAYYADRNSHVDARDRVMAKLAAMGYGGEWAMVISGGPCHSPGSKSLVSISKEV